MADGIWDILGISATDDERAIRIAYSQRLKTIDVDRDARGFIALRSAYEAARACVKGEAGSGSWLDNDALVDPRSGSVEVGLADVQTELLAPALIEPTTGDDHHVGVTDPEPNSLLQEIAALHRLFEDAARQQRRWLTPEEKLELRRAWSTIAAEIERGNIDQYGETEARIRWLILSWGILAVGLVPFAVEFFHWDRHEGGLAEDGGVGEIMWHYRGIQFLQRVRRPDHSHHPAWSELTSRYFPGSSRGRCDPLLVHELQAVVRHVWPEVETEFDPGRVALWQNNTADPTHPENPNAPMPVRVVRALKIVGGLYLLYVIISILAR